MNQQSIPLHDVVAGLHAEGVLDGQQAASAEALVARLGSVSPWYLRVMVALGAWLTSLLLVGFVVLLAVLAHRDDNFNAGIFMLIGVGMICGAWVMRKQVGDDFAVQVSLALSLAGQVVLTSALAMWVERSIESMVPLLCGVILVVNVALFVVFPDHIHRVLSVLFATSALVVLLVARELYVCLPFLGPALAGALVMVYRNRAAIVAAGYGYLVRPLETGLMLAAFGCLLLSIEYLWPLLELEQVHLPHAWVSTLLLGGIFLYVGDFTLTRQMLRTGPEAEATLYLLMLAVVACAWAAPGILLALIVLMLGAGEVRPTVVGAGIAFLVIFVSAYFYGMQTTMLAKSVTLIATGASILVARGALRWLFTSRGAGRDTVDSHA